MRVKGLAPSENGKLFIVNFLSSLASLVRVFAYAFPSKATKTPLKDATLTKKIITFFPGAATYTQIDKIDG